MIPKRPLPLSDEWENTGAYVDSLLSFATSSALFRTLCGGVHILDFLTREPDLYSTVLPSDWREFFDQHEIGDILDLLLREDIEPLRRNISQSSNNGNPEQEEEGANSRKTMTWRDGPAPPEGLLEYIYQIRRHSFKRGFTPNSDNLGDGRQPAGTAPRHASVGMRPKKWHEVENFSRYVDHLTADVNRIRGIDPGGEEGAGGVTHIVDFGSGQNYLGRTLANAPFNKHVVAIERQQHNISGAKGKDVLAKQAKKKVVLKNKKQLGRDAEAESPSARPLNGSDESEIPPENDNSVTVIHVVDEGTNSGGISRDNESGKERGKEERPQGHIDYVEHDIQDGYLEPIIDHIINDPQQISTKDSEPPSTPTSSVMVVSLHSCGNLVHHGIRSLVLNPSVAAIAMIGCCYNLMTERLGPETWKLPSLRSANRRLELTATANDPHGFPMSRLLETYPQEIGPGIRLNITARMMAVQAPDNWGPEDSEGFFKRHFFRALLQRVLMDYGIVPRPGVSGSDLKGDGDGDGDGGSPEDETSGTPLIVGCLRKNAFTSFPVYARAAIAKLVHDEHYGSLIEEKLSDLSDDELDAYVRQYWSAKKNLSVAWSLMAFSAQVVEAIIVTDRWLFLQEQDEVKHAWVETVFEYSQSPRNLVVVGLKN